jgi:multiple sugar transport system permease protein
MRQKYKPGDYMAPRSPIVYGVNYFLLAVMSVIILFPITILVNISFKSNEEYFYSGPFVLAENLFNTANFKTVFEAANFMLGFKNTGILMLVSVTGSILMGLMVSYVIGRFDFKYRAIVSNAFILATIIPNITTQVATFSIIKSMGIFNTLWAGIVLYIATDIVSIYVFLQYISKIPKSLDESGMIDGASYFRIFFSIILPQMRPAILTMAIIKAISVYNDIFIPYIYMPKSSLRTVATTIRYFSQDRNSQWNLMAAAILTAMIPTLIVYFICQKGIISGLTDGAVKE